MLTWFTPIQECMYTNKDKVGGPAAYVNSNKQINHVHIRLCGSRDLLWSDTDVSDPDVTSTPGKSLTFALMPATTASMCTCW